MAKVVITSAILRRGAREGAAQLLPAAGSGRLLHTIFEIADLAGKTRGTTP
ncbi:hypothetical protein C2845_PM06G31550 [Panicum miliaceum]|uniref:Uncharacterized protein n=1 Tax=Panicum miliaceum TaxID=4540 RepID=A0A3L6R6A1_PANMI|nr:hypothetical protein C2845_PM06G31550 [Panicum miliaceum]